MGIVEVLVDDLAGLLELLRRRVILRRPDLGPYFKIVITNVQDTAFFIGKVVIASDDVDVVLASENCKFSVAQIVLTDQLRERLYFH